MFVKYNFYLLLFNQRRKYVKWRHCLRLIIGKKLRKNKNGTITKNFFLLLPFVKCHTYFIYLYVDKTIFIIGIVIDSKVNIE